MATEHRAADRPRRSPESDRTSVPHRSPTDLSPAELLELIGDDYTRRVLRLVAGEPMGGRDVAEETDVSRATAYRHLNKLREAGLVETRMACDPDGHHHEQFHAVLERADLSFDRSGLTASVSLERGDAGRAAPGSAAGRLGDD